MPEYVIDIDLTGASDEQLLVRFTSELVSGHPDELTIDGHLIMEIARAYGSWVVAEGERGAPDTISELGQLIVGITLGALTMRAVITQPQPEDHHR